MLSGFTEIPHKLFFDDMRQGITPAFPFHPWRKQASHYLENLVQLDKQKIETPINFNPCALEEQITRVRNKQPHVLSRMTSRAGSQQ